MLTSYWIIFLPLLSVVLPNILITFFFQHKFNLLGWKKYTYRYELRNETTKLLTITHLYEPQVVFRIISLPNADQDHVTYITRRNYTPYQLAIKREILYCFFMQGLNIVIYIAYQISICQSLISTLFWERCAKTFQTRKLSIVKYGNISFSDVILFT